LIAIGSEALQFFISTRHARLADAAEKAAGGLVGALAVAVAERARRSP
jgi:VanZ family protein